MSLFLLGTDQWAKQSSMQYADKNPDSKEKIPSPYLSFLFGITGAVGQPAYLTGVF
jgi:hypothetical protein